MNNSHAPFGLSLSKPFDKLRVNGSPQSKELEP